MWLIPYLIAALLGYIDCKIPSYLNPCSISSKGLTSCFLEQGNIVISHIVNGDKTLGIPNLNPLMIPKLELENLHGLSLTFHDAYLYGLSEARLTDAKVDFDAKKVEIQVDIKQASLISPYEVNGKILILSIEGKGNSNSTVDNVRFKYTYEYELENRNGAQHIIMKPNDKFQLTIDRAYFNYEGLFGGNKEMGDNINKFLNENWQEVFKEMGGGIESAFTLIARTVAQGLFKHVSFDELFLP
ncbi:protein takeout-like [Cylas formicarius]|uniref:protein takeout-like n=1 Tax=Cylas formicarius TaxID=197179 RepID=UPI0029584E31|nr:protein takeout-like [Cylas formicarius]